MRLEFFKRGVVQILIAVACGIVLGRWHPALAVEMKPLSDGFVRLIGMPISLLVFALVVAVVRRLFDWTSACMLAKSTTRVGITTMAPST